MALPAGGARGWAVGRQPWPCRRKSDVCYYLHGYRNGNARRTAILELLSGRVFKALALIPNMPTPPPGQNGAAHSVHEAQHGR